jgi:hypothetical protein
MRSQAEKCTTFSDIAYLISIPQFLGGHSPGQTVNTPHFTDLTLMNNILWVFVKDMLFYPHLPKNVTDLKNKVIANGTDENLHQSEKLEATLKSCSCCNLM